jgi:hypothetical protein
MKIVRGREFGSQYWGLTDLVNQYFGNLMFTPLSLRGGMGGSTFDILYWEVMYADNE